MKAYEETVVALDELTRFDFDWLRDGMDPDAVEAASRSIGAAERRLLLKAARQGTLT